MADRYAALDKHVNEFQEFLRKVRQGRDGGIKLLKKCKECYSVPVIMFTRKGTLNDEIACRDAGADDVLKKPMPPQWPEDPHARKKAMDDALASGPAAESLKSHFRDAIDKNSF